jgi:hypothetical protein
VLMVREPYRHHPRTQALFNQLIEHITRLAEPHQDVMVHSKPLTYVV